MELLFLEPNLVTNKMILGFDPGKDKCGIAIIGNERQLYYHEVVASVDAIAIFKSLLQQFPIETLVMGNQTTAKSWKEKLEAQLPTTISLIMVDERNSTLEARDRYWQMYPAKGFNRLLPEGMRLPPRPIDDIVAILLIERYFKEMRD